MLEHKLKRVLGVCTGTVIGLIMLNVAVPPPAAADCSFPDLETCQASYNCYVIGPTGDTTYVGECEVCVECEPHTLEE
jgi:hypothetical protein